MEDIGTCGIWSTMEVLRNRSQIQVILISHSTGFVGTFQDNLEVPNIPLNPKIVAGQSKRNDAILSRRRSPGTPPEYVPIAE